MDPLARKSKRLQWVAEALRGRFGEAVAFVDNWPTDSEAVGVVKLGTDAPLAYVSSVVEVSRELYTVALEHVRDPSGDAPYEPGALADQLTLDSAVELVASHLKLVRGAT